MTSPTQRIGPDLIPIWEEDEDWYYDDDEWLDCCPHCGAEIEDYEWDCWWCGSEID